MALLAVDAPPRREPRPARVARINGRRWVSPGQQAESRVDGQDSAPPRPRKSGDRPHPRLTESLRLGRTIRIGRASLYVDRMMRDKPA